MNFTPDGPHLLDTSAVILMMRHGATAMSEATVPFVVFAELLTGSVRARDPFREREKMYTALGSAAIIYPNLESLNIYSRISAQLQRAGLPIPTNDIWIAALALQHGLPVLSDDDHFRRVPGLKFFSVR